MESYRLLDTARRSPAEHAALARRSRLLPRLPLCLLALLVFACLRLHAQTAPPPQLPTEQQLQALADAQRWDQIVLLLAPLQPRTASMDYYYGAALAHLERWPQAQLALLAGQRLAPSDPRFPVELAGIAFRQKQYVRAAHHLRRALRLAPQDAYANDFLATVYFLQGNIPAALKYWNRIGKPRIADVRPDPVPRVSPALLDRAFAFAPASTLFEPQWHATATRIDGLGIFPQHQLDLRARPDGDFDVVFRNRERNGFGDTRLESVFLVLRGIPFQGVTPEYDNLHRQAINITSLFRWDPQKRRAFAQYSAPFHRSARYRYALTADLRNENWALVTSFTGPATTLASLNLRTAVFGFQLDSFSSDRFRWSAGAQLSHRDYRSVVPGSVSGSVSG